MEGSLLRLLGAGGYFGEVGWDADLLRRFRDGDPEALADVFREHAEGLARSLRAMVFGKEFPRLRWQVDIENTVLETFARAFEPRARAVYDGVRPYGHFLGGIARNVLYEQARGREFPSGLSPDELQQHPGSAAPELEASASELFENRELASLLEGFEAGLDEQERPLFALRFDQAVPQESAAEQLGLSRIQLRRRELALKKKLVEFMRTHGYLGEVELRQWTFVRRSDP
ncbi:MAG: sigma-70 family RNA polymerase sigma factor [Myxococcota bacterium]|nr:sigma-70 family RNA polymerase sigma factor [Myxococcota bacterium]